MWLISAAESRERGCVSGRATGKTLGGAAGDLLEEGERGEVVADPDASCPVARVQVSPAALRPSAQLHAVVCNPGPSASKG